LPLKTLLFILNAVDDGTTVAFGRQFHNWSRIWLIGSFLVSIKFSLGT